jgi:hypothetical protein
MGGQEAAAVAVCVGWHNTLEAANSKGIYKGVSVVVTCAASIRCHGAR